jgi:DNA-binding FadR family transcriptional regulator
MRRHLEAEADYVNRHKPKRPRLGAIFVSSTGESKLAESIARTIFAGIVDDGWRVGQPLGSESDLMERYGVSRAILREAVRMLEFHQIAVMRRGPGGGLFVAAPGIDATADAVTIYLERRAIRPEHLFEVRSIIELKVLDRVIESLDDEMIRRLAEAHEVEEQASPETFPVYGHDLHVVLGELSGNRVLALLADVVVRLSRSHSAAPDGAPARLPTEDVVRTHERIIEAIVARDAELARHRMRRHLSALVQWTR